MQSYCFCFNIKAKNKKFRLTSCAAFLILRRKYGFSFNYLKFIMTILTLFAKKPYLCTYL